MKYLAAVLLLSFSVWGMEEVTQTITVTATEKNFTLLDINFGRGDGQWVVERTFSSQENSTPVAKRISPALSSPFPYVQAFLDYNATQIKPLFGQKNVRYAPAFSMLNISSIPGGFKYVRPSLHFVGTETATYSYFDCGADFLSPDNDVELVRFTVQFVSPNTPPTITVVASPNAALVGQSVSLQPTASDLDEQVLSINYDYGDGTTGASTVHSYASAGTYSVTATVTDGFGGSASASTQVVIVDPPTVLDPATNSPTARFVTSSLLAVVATPFTFDASTSTDPQNNIIGYSWDFGDGSPKGVGTILSKSFSEVGTFTVTLTVLDLDGFSSTTTREIEVVTEQEAVSSEGEVSFKATVQPLREGRDVFTLTARLPVGALAVAAGSVVALEVGGVRVEGTLDKRLRTTGTQAFTVRAGVRTLPTGTVEIRFKGRALRVATGLTALGATDEALIVVPVRIELNGKTFVVPVDADCEFNATGTRGTITGAL